MWACRSSHRPSRESGNTSSICKRINGGLLGEGSKRRIDDEGSRNRFTFARARFRENQFVAAVEKALSQADGLGPRTRREHDATFPWLRTPWSQCRLPI